MQQVQIKTKADQYTPSEKGQVPGLRKNLLSASKNAGSSMAKLRNGEIFFIFA